MHRGAAALLLLASLGLPIAAWAAGGAHIVDDSEVEPAGHCHVEMWVSKFVPGDGYGNLGPACTLGKVPNLEVGGLLQHYWDEATNAPFAGPQAKLNLKPASSGFGLAVEFNGGVNLRTGDLGFAQALVPLTIPFLDDKVHLNLNVGWSYTNGTEAPHAMFYGAQVEADIGFGLSLMIEGFGRTNGVSGLQMGLRFTPNDGPIDFDLLAGNFFDTLSSRFFTVGVTVRF